MNSVSIIAALKNDIMELILDDGEHQTRTSLKNNYSNLRNYIEANRENTFGVYILGDNNSIGIDYLPLIQVCKARNIEVYFYKGEMRPDTSFADIKGKLEPLYSLHSKGLFNSLRDAYDLQKKCKNCRRRTPDTTAGLCPYMQGSSESNECELNTIKSILPPTEIPTSQWDPVTEQFTTEHWDIDCIQFFNAQCDKLIGHCSGNDPFALQWGHKKGKAHEKDGVVRNHINRLKECLFESATDKGADTWIKHKQIIDNLGEGNFVDTLHEANKILMSLQDEKAEMDCRTVRHTDLRVLYRLWRMVNNEHFLWIYGEVETALTHINIRKNKEYLAFLLYEMKEFIKNYNNSRLQNPWCRLEVNVNDVYNADDRQWREMLGSKSSTPAFHVHGYGGKERGRAVRTADTLERYTDILHSLSRTSRQIVSLDIITDMPTLNEPFFKRYFIYDHGSCGCVRRSELSYNFLDEVHNIVSHYYTVLGKDERLVNFDFEKIIMEKRIDNYLQNMVEKKLVTKTQSGTYVAAGKKTMELALYAIIARIARPFYNGEYVSWEGDHFSYEKDSLKAAVCDQDGDLFVRKQDQGPILEKYSLEGFLQTRQKERLAGYEERLAKARESGNQEDIMMLESICEQIRSEKDSAKIRFDALEGLIITQHNGSNVKGPYAISPTSYRDSILHLRHKRPSCIIRKKKDGTIEELPTNPDFVYPYEKAIAIVDAIRRYGYEFFTTFPGCIPEDHLLYNYRYKDIEMVTEPTKDILE